MALTVNQTPDAYTPASSQQIFHATSTNSAAANHSYVVVCTDIITGNSFRYLIAKDPIYSSMVFDAKGFTENYIQYFKPLLIGGWQKCTGSIRPITVNVGEQYGSTVIYYPGTNFNYTVWSGIVDFLGFAGGVFDSGKYIYSAGTNNVYMAGVTDDLAFTNKSSWLYILSNHNTGTRPGQIQVVSYNAAGVAIGSSFINNPHAAGGNTYDKNFVCIDIGDRGLNNLTAPQVTGTFPVLPAGTASYEVRDSTGTAVVIKTFKYGCVNKFTPINIHYLAKNGALQTASFNLMHDKFMDTQSQIYGKNPNVNNGFYYEYSINSAPNIDYAITEQQSLKLRTDWLSIDQIKKYKECVSSPICYLEGDSDYPNSLIRVRRVSGRYIDVPKNKKLFAIELDFVYAHENYRQHV
jgi:hypothetical protein